MVARQPDGRFLLAEAAALLRAGRHFDAITPLREAARLRPGDADILHDLGLACLESGQVGEAVAVLQAAIAANPRYADAYLRLGIALEAAGAPEEALAAYRKASTLVPSLADAHFRAGDLLLSLSRSSDAVASYRRAVIASPKTTLGRIASAKALQAEDRDREAEKVLRQALALDKHNAAALELLGNWLADAGQFDEARALLLQAIERAPLRAGSYYDVVRCRRVTREDDTLIVRMNEAAALPGLEPAQRARVHLALGKALDDLGDYQSAMRHFDVAEALRAAIMPFDLAAFDAHVDRLIDWFTEARIAGAARPLPVGEGPILILGLPRSGTTLVEQILSAHPEVTACGELAFWNEQGAAWEGSGMPEPSPPALEGMAADYLRLLQSLAPGGKRVTDKMPLNIQWAGLIHLALPGATIMHCRRSPIDTALSIHQTHFNPRMAFPTGGAALVGYIRATRRLAAHWRQVLPAGRFIEVDYEALTTDPDPSIRRFIAACALPWSDACLCPQDNKRMIKTPSKWQVRQPITSTSVGRWRAYEPWLGALRPLLDDSGATQAAAQD